MTPLKNHVFENIIENEAFALWSTFHNNFKSIQNVTYFFLKFFQCCLKKKMVSLSKNSLWSKGSIALKTNSDTHRSSTNVFL